MSFWTGYWITMAVMVTVADIIAATNKQKGDTLSEHIWLWMKHRWFRILLVVALSLISVHLLTGGWI